MRISRVIVFFALVAGFSVFGTAQQDAVLVGAANIASCDDLAGAQATAKLIENIPGTVFAVGDLAYQTAPTSSLRNAMRRLGGDSKIGHALLPFTGVLGFLRPYSFSANDRFASGLPRQSAT